MLKFTLIPVSCQPHQKLAHSLTCCQEAVIKRRLIGWLVGGERERERGGCKFSAYPSTVSVCARKAFLKSAIEQERKKQTKKNG